MTGLRTVAERLRRIDRHPVLSYERLFDAQRVSANLERRRLGRRAGPARLLRQRLAAIDVGAADAPVLIAGALAEERRSLDRALIHAYLAALPCPHDDVLRLRDAARIAAERHDWPWRDRGQRLALWSPERDTDGTWRLPDAALAELARSG